MPKASTRAAQATRGSPRKLPAELRCRQCPDLPLRNQCPHSAEGRSYLAAQATSKPERAPQRCTRCPGRPIRAQCPHTNAGREFLRQKDIEQNLAGALADSGPGYDSQSMVNNIPEAVSASSGLEIVRPPAILEDSFDFSTPTRSSVPAPQAVNTHLPIFPPVNFSQLIPIDPVLSTPQANRVTGSPQLPMLPTFTPRSEISTDGGSSTSSTHMFAAASPVTPSQSAATSTIQARKKYVRPTKANPKFGYVKAAMRGTHELAVLRKHERPSASKDSVSASKDFLEGMHRVLEKAEDVSVKTGCWIFIGAQHPGASGGTIHYTSPRLRRDAPDDTEHIVNDYNILMTSLLRARRSDALEASKKLEEAVQKNAELQSEVTALKNVIKQYSNGVDDKQLEPSK